jgi:hypothetical protein
LCGASEETQSRLSKRFAIAAEPGTQAFFQRRYLKWHITEANGGLCSLDMTMAAPFDIPPSRSAQLTTNSSSAK